METLSWWWLCAFGGTCVFLLFLLRLLRLQTGIVRSHDQQLWTVSDYAVLIEGLEKGKEVDAQEATLRADLERVAGIREEDISHIEIGCGCRREQRLLEKIARLRVALQELNVRCQLDATRQARLEAVKAELKAARSALEALRGDDDGHVTTGQAFVVFQLEKTRNEVIRLFEPETHESSAALTARLLTPHEHSCTPADAARLRQPRARRRLHHHTWRDKHRRSCR